jgi:hypothetical protein
VAAACGGLVASVSKDAGARADIDFKSPNDGFSLGNEGTFAHEGAGSNGIVLDVRSRVVREDGGTPERRDIDVDVALEGRRSPS